MLDAAGVLVSEQKYVQLISTMKSMFARFKYLPVIVALIGLVMFFTKFK